MSNQDNSHPKYTEEKQTKRGRKKVPYFIGEGIKVEPEEKFVKFGNVILNKALLYRRNRLAIKYPSGACIPEFPSRVISNKLKEMIRHILEHKSVDQKLLKELDMNDNQLLSNLVYKARLDGQLGLTHYRSEDTENDMKRFELLKGMVLAGSNSPETLKELRLLIMKFMMNGLMNKGEGNQLLLELNTIV